jgi:hypothetical protein
MSDGGRGDEGEDPQVPAETSLVRLLAPLRDEQPARLEVATDRIIRRARWQRTVRSALHAAATVAASAADGARLLLGVGAKRDPR